MRRNSIIAVLIVVISLPTVAFSQDARSILETAQKKQLQRWEGVDFYVVRQSIIGSQSDTFIQRTRVKDHAGNSQVMFLLTRNAKQNGCRCPGTRQ